MAGLLRHRRFACLCLLSGVPAKLIYAAFMMYLAPVYLSTLGASKAEIGRYAMMYGLLVLLFAPLFSWLADRLRAYAWLVCCGALLSAAGLLLISVLPGQQSVLLAICTLGLGQAMSLTAQFVLVNAVTAELEGSSPNSIVGVFRLIERLGAAAGPTLAGALATGLGLQASLAVLGGFGLLCAALFALLYARSGRRA